MPILQDLKQAGRSGNKVADGDLPKRDERFETEVSVSVFSSKGKLVVYYFETKEWYCNGQKEEVIAWCEISKFEELEK